MLSLRTKVDYRSIAKNHYSVELDGMHVHHKDGNSHNNDPENLVVCTPKEHAQYHREMGQEPIALLLEGQNGSNWFSVIGKMGGLARKGSKIESYTMSNDAYIQRAYARNNKGDPMNTNLSLRGHSRTEKQKIGKLKAVETKAQRKLTELELQQLKNFSTKGSEIARINMTGSKKLINNDTGEFKFAKPNTPKWFNLLNNNFKVKE